MSLDQSHRLRRLARRIVSPPIVLLAVIWALLELTLWRWLTALGRMMARVPIFAALERLVERLSPGWVIAIFVTPFIPLLPLLKLTELWLLTHGHYVSAVALIIGTKVAGAAFSTRVFAIARPKMLQVAWFAKLYRGVTWLMELGHRTLEGLAAWRVARDWVSRAKPRFSSLGKGMIRRIWDPALRWVRRKTS